MLNIYWIQVRDLTLASLRARYRKTFAGFIWVLLNPLIQFGVQSLVFKQFLRLDIPNYSLFLLGGLLPWIFITSTISMGTGIFVSQSHLLKSFKINPMVIISSQILDNFFNFIVSVLIILIPVYFFYERPLLNIIALPLAFLPLLLTTASITVALAITNVFFRDTSFLVGFVINLLFFLTPVFYPRELVPETYQWIIDFNPLMYVIEPFRNLFIAPSWEEFLFSVVKGLGVSLIAMGVSVLLWKRKQNAFYFKI